MDIQKIPVSLISPSPMNPRKTFDEEALEELAENIGKQGLLQPITIRPIADIYGFAEKIGWKKAQPPHYEIVCGERRFRAFSLLDGRANDLSFSAIPAIVREMDDEEAFDAMITENLQRKDVDPMEEAFAFGQLIQNGKTAEEVAARFGKSVRFVQDRVKLNNLIPELREAVSEDRMPIVSALMVAKLDEKWQHSFHSQYRHHHAGYSKSNAEGFINGLFMKLSQSLWCKGGNEDFTGGCARKCSECPKNTANHGCLFWEMKSEDGKCTDRERFEGKTLAYIMSEIGRRAPYIVRKGESLAFGKIALITSEYGYVPEWCKGLKDRLAEEIDRKGFATFNPYATFGRVVSYPVDDERTQEMLENGEAYRCLSIFGSSGPEVEERAYHVREDDMAVNASEDGTPRQVTELLARLRRAETGLPLDLNSAAVMTLDSCTPHSDALLDDEITLCVAIMLFNSMSARKHLSIPEHWGADEYVRFVAGRPKELNRIIRSWMFQRFTTDHAARKMAEPLMKDLCAVNCPDAYAKAEKKILNAHEKLVAKLVKELGELGYDRDGNPIAKAEDVKREFAAMKAKHPDAIVLFRIGDFYECYGEDADKAAEILKLTVANPDDEWRKCAFPHHALDKYLPMIVRSGNRLAICENLSKDKSKR